MSRHVIVEADGGSRGNPGPAGYGALVKDAATGELLAERQASLGTTTNNVAEYSGLIAGLAAAAEVGASIVDVRMDSKLVVEQMSGRWKIKNAAMQSLAAQAQDLAAGFTRVRYEWIPRASNSHADRLANAAMDTQAESGADFGIDSTVDSVVSAVENLTSWTGIESEPTRLILVRHGQTAMSAERRYSGRGEVPLTELGQRQALAAAQRVATLVGTDLQPAAEDALFAKPISIIASPLMRAQQTAAAIANAVGGQVTTHPGLIESDFGDWEGLTFAEASERDPEVHRRWLTDVTTTVPGGESLATVHQRVVKVRDELVAKYPAQTVVVVSHVNPLKSLVRLGLAAGPEMHRRMHLDLASLSIVNFYPDDRALVRLVNDTSYLSHLS